MDIRIPTLSENTANVGFIGEWEWGLSILIEADVSRILFDTARLVRRVDGAFIVRSEFL